MKKRLTKNCNDGKNLIDSYMSTRVNFRVAIKLLFLLRCRADRRQKEKEATDKSRKQQLRDRAERKARQLEEASVLIKQWTEHGAKVEKILEHEEEDRRKEDTRVAGILKAQADAKKSRLMV